MRSLLFHFAIIGIFHSPEMILTGNNKSSIMYISFRPKSTILFYNCSNFLWSFSTFHLKKTFVRKSFRKLIFMLLQWPKVLHCCKFELFITQWRIFFILLSFFLQTKWKVWRSLYKTTLKVCMHIALNIQLGNHKSTLRSMLFYSLKNLSNKNKRLYCFMVAI